MTNQVFSRTNASLGDMNDMQNEGIKQCPICNGNPNESFHTKFLRVLKCGNPQCGHLYAADAAPDHGIVKQLDPEAKREKYTERNRRLVRFWKKQGFMCGESKVLDVGAGVGHIAEAIRDLLDVGDITCIEPDSESRERLTKNKFDVAESLGDCQDYFDAVLLIEVIEHVDSPVKLLMEIRRHMLPEGKLFVTTPCGETRKGNRKTNAYDTPEHVHFFTENSLVWALQCGGFKKINFLTVPQLYPRDTNPRATLIPRLKDITRSIRNRLLGYTHLVAFAK
jgi:SAM-dependent methyltransferase